MKRLKRVNNKLLVKISIRIFLVNLLAFNFIFLSCKSDQQKNARKCIDSIESIQQKSIYLKLCQEIAPTYDLQNALIEAKKSNKLLLVIFNSMTCVNCRAFEDKVLFNSYVKAYLYENFITSVLFVDDNTILPSEKWVKSKITRKWLKSIGSINSEIQRVEIRSGSQPYIVVLNHDKAVLAETSTLFSDSGLFLKWLNTIDTGNTLKE